MGKSQTKFQRRLASLPSVHSFFNGSHRFSYLKFITVQKRAKFVGLGKFYKMIFASENRPQYSQERASRSFSKVKELGGVLSDRVRGHTSFGVSSSIRSRFGVRVGASRLAGRGDGYAECGRASGHVVCREKQPVAAPNHPNRCRLLRDRLLAIKQDSAICCSHLEY